MNTAFILERKEFKNWCSNNYSTIFNVFDDITSDEEKRCINERLISIDTVKSFNLLSRKEYNASEVKKIRNSIGMSQKTFASYLGVSCKTVEAWETGTNHPSGAASRLLNMMEMDENLTKEFPFVTIEE